MDSSDRPWPVPSTPWVLTQTWHQLLFAHWQVDPDVLRAHIPEHLTLDTYNGQAWIGIVPFYISGSRMRFVPAIPFTAKFPELNVRTYVTCGDKPGVYFFSLDAANLLAVKGARTFFHLPYYFSKIYVKYEDGTTYYSCQRIGTQKEFEARYRPVSQPFYAERGSLAYWLSERYCLYTVRKHRLYRCDILHQPWPLQHAEASILKNTMVDLEGLSLSEPPLLHYSNRQKTFIRSLQKVEFT